MDTLKVRDAADVEQVVRSALASEQPLEIIGHGSKRLIGQPMATNALLDLSALNAVTAYEPNELIITVQAGAPLADVLSLIDSKNQQFAFEPINTSQLLGTPDIGTIGGMIGAGLAGPRRIKAGGARDHLLGAHAVSGLRRQFQGRRQGREKRHRLRSLQAAGGILGHAGGDDRSDLEGDAEARERTHAGAARAGRRHREPGDDGGAGLAVRCVGRGASAELGVSSGGAGGVGGSRIAAAGGHAAAAGRHCGVGRPSRRRAWRRCWRRLGRWRFSKMRPRRRSGVRFATFSRSRPTARWERGRCGASSVRRPRAARSASGWRAIPAATCSTTGAAA